ncbi:hypothetical protein BGW37DRAFT_472497 [Umbelopsis sp. PMI_123]|nr:hypothetical protein BGW37DRAFT_472497 [Umbelopsis sp. PMI_123]
MSHFNTNTESQITLNDVLSYWVPHSQLPTSSDLPRQPLLPTCRVRQSKESQVFSLKQLSNCENSNDQKTEIARSSQSLETHHHQQCELQTSMIECTHVSYSELSNFLNPKFSQLEQKLDSILSSLSDVHVQIDRFRMSGSHQIKSAPRINKKRQNNLPVLVQPIPYEDEINVKPHARYSKRRSSLNERIERQKRYKSAAYDDLPSVRSAAWKESSLERKRRVLLTKAIEELVFVSC